MIRLYLQDFIADFVLVRYAAAILFPIVDSRGALSALLHVVPVGDVLDVQGHVSTEN
jgi:hypothetical protein